jgi:hypothetical protein
MNHKKHTFETRGPVDPAHNYVVSRHQKITEFKERIKQGRYIVIFAPRQTGKTTFFRWALDAIEAEDETYFPIQLDFETYRNISISDFYGCFHQDMCEEILYNFQKRQLILPDDLHQFLENSNITNHISMLDFFKQIFGFLKNRKIMIIIDEFDGIPAAAVSDFLYSLRRLYLSKNKSRCPYSVGIIGVKNITQLNYDRSISPFNIQDDLALPNFTVLQVRELLEQYMEEVGQTIVPAISKSLYKRTAGQPFLVNRIAQILTEEMEIPLSKAITQADFEIAHQQILDEPNVHLTHLTTNIRRNPRFEPFLMGIISYDAGVRFNLHNEVISELATYGVLKKGTDGLCEIANPIYQYCIVQTFQPLINGLEREYLSEETHIDFADYLTPEGNINMRELLSNFRDFIARAGYRILQVPDTPKEFVGQYLLFAYLDTFVRQVHGFMYLEVRTGRGRMDMIILHKSFKYIIETKIWEGIKRFSAGKRQLADYLKLEGVSEGYYVVFDHRSKPQALLETDEIEEQTIISYTIPVVQEKPSNK